MVVTEEGALDSDTTVLDKEEKISAVYRYCRAYRLFHVTHPAGPRLHSMH